MPKYLIEQGQTFCYAPSLSTWAVLRSPARVANNVQAIAISEFASARPLPGSKQDLNNLQEAFADVKIDIVQDNHATEEKLREMLRKQGFTYNATHGDTDADGRLVYYG